MAWVTGSGRTRNHKEHQMSDKNPTTTTEPELVEEALVEEVSIDGMCGVY